MFRLSEEKRKKKILKKSGTYTLDSNKFNNPDGIRDKLPDTVKALNEYVGKEVIKIEDD